MTWKHQVRYKDGSTEDHSYTTEEVVAKFGDLIWTQWFDGNLTGITADRKESSTWGDVEIDTNNGVKIGSEYFWLEDE